MEKIPNMENNMGKICKNCKYWTHYNNSFGECSSDKLFYGSGMSLNQEDNDGLCYGDAEMYSAFLYTGESFGCVHFRTK